MPEVNDTQTALNAGLAQARAFEINGVPAVLVPEGAMLMELKHLALAPQRIDQIVRLNAAEDFIEYHNKFATGASIIFCDLAPAHFVSVLDYHEEPMTPEWCKHLAVYTCPKTVEWSDWLAKSGKPQNQTEFAQFIEDHLPDIVEPTGARMLEIAKTLHAVKGVNFRKAIRLENGENQLVYEERIEGSAGEKGEFQIPSTFKIGLRLFEGGDGYEIECRLRYRLNDAQLALWYEIVRPHKVHEDAVLGVFKQIKDNMTRGTLLRGIWKTP